jgi:hypothetical protein
MAANQCTACRYWERRGGLVGERRLKTCVVLEGFGEPLAGAVSGLLRLAASTGACPSFETPPTYPDSYRAVDLEDQEDEQGSKGEFADEMEARVGELAA